MDKDTKQGGKGSHLGLVKRLTETRDPTEVEKHLKLVATALHADGYGDEVCILDPRSEYKPHMAPSYDARKHGMSTASLNAMDPLERPRAIRNWIEKFEAERQRLDNVTREGEKKLFHLLLDTLGPSSQGRITSHGLKAFEKAETQRDIKYLVETLITTHSSSVATGLSVIATQQMMMKRVSKYMSCEQGSMTLDEYLHVMNEHDPFILGE